MRGGTTRVSVQSRHYNKTEQIQKITVRDYNYYSVSHLCIDKQHSMFMKFLLPRLVRLPERVKL